MNNKDDILEKRKQLKNKDDGEKLYEIKKNDKGMYVHGNESKKNETLEKYRKIVTTVVIGFMELIFLSIALTSQNTVIGMFIACIMLLMLVPVAQVYEKDNIVELISKLYLLIFFGFFFGGLGLATYNALKVNNIEIALMTIPFWIVGIIIVIRIILKKK